MGKDEKKGCIGDCCLTMDNEKGFDLCGMVCCTYQCGTGACCVKDTDGHCFALICCECQCNILCPIVALCHLLGGVTCCAGAALKSAGVATGQAAFATTAAAAAGAGVVGYSAVGGLFNCCAGDGGSCCLLTGLFCLAPLVMPCYYAGNARLIDSATSFPENCMCCILASLVGCGWAVTSTKRAELHYTLGIEDKCFLPCIPDCCAGACTHFWCMPCALVEERKVLKANGLSGEKTAVMKYQEIISAQPTAEDTEKPETGV